MRSPGKSHALRADAGVVVVSPDFLRSLVAQCVREEVRQALADISEKREQKPPRIEHERLLKLPEVLATVGMKKTAWYAGIREGRFPKPIKRGARDTVWPMSAIQKIVSDALGRGGQ